MEIEIFNTGLLQHIVDLINRSKNKAAVYLNSEVSLLYWQIGTYINIELVNKGMVQYGSKILATLSQELTNRFGKGFNYSALTRMCKVARTFDEQNIATLSQQISWSHFIELSGIDELTKRQFYTILCSNERWGVRQLRDNIDNMLFERTVIAKQPDEIINSALQNLQKNVADTDLVFKNSYILDFLNLPKNYSEKELENALVSNIEQFILELGNGFAFLERQKRLSIDTTDYYLDLLFYHRKLKRLVAIDLKLGKFKPEYKAQMELYLRYLQRYDMQDGEQNPIGLLLCSEGNTEHIELLMLDEKNIKVAQYFTELPSKEWFANKLHKAIEIAKSNTLNQKQERYSD